MLEPVTCTLRSCNAVPLAVHGSNAFYMQCHQAFSSSALLVSIVTPRLCQAVSSEGAPDKARKVGLKPEAPAAAAGLSLAQHKHVVRLQLVLVVLPFHP